MNPTIFNISIPSSYLNVLLLLSPHLPQILEKTNIVIRKLNKF